MTDRATEICRARRVPEREIRWLYESEGRGLRAEGLIEDAGIRLWQPCRGKVSVSEARRRAIRPGLTARLFSLLAALLACDFMLAGNALAGGGVIEINQASALAGGVTPDDDPGFPVTISEPGSYQLTGNLTHSDPDVDFVLVDASHVDLDLNGFEIAGPASCASFPCSGAGTGVGVNQPTLVYGALTVRNGTIRGAGYTAIQILGSSARISDVRAIESGGVGFQLQFADGAVVEDCVALRNASVGIWAGPRTRVVRSSAALNEEIGIYCAQSCSVLDSTAVSNGGSGITGNAGSHYVRGSLSSRNGSDGIDILTGTALDNVSVANTGVGLNVRVTTPPSSYGRNLLQGNNGGNANPQVAGGPLEVGTNLCGTNTTCP